MIVPHNDASLGFKPPFRGIFIAAVIFTLGIVLKGDFPGFNVRLAILVFSISITLTLVFLKVIPRYHSLLVVLTWFLLGWTCASRQSISTTVPTGQAWLGGKILYPVERSKEGIRLRVNLNHWRQASDVGRLDHPALVTLKHTIDVRPGDKVSLIGEITKMSGPRNPGDFDERAYWGIRGIHWKILSPKGVSITPVNTPPLLIRKMDGLRSELQQFIESRFSAQNVPSALALITGDRTRWDESLRDAYKRSGLMHLFAISGLHVGLMILLFFSLTSLFVADQRIRWLITLLALWLYVPLTGSNPPVIRAVIMSTFAAGSVLLGRHRFIGYSLVLAYLFLLFLRPSGFYDTGFRLSFAGAAGVLLTAHVFKDWRKPLFLRGAKWVRRLKAKLVVLAFSFLVSLGAWVFTAPILAWSFGQVSLLAMILVLPALFVLFLAMAATWLGLFTAWFPLISAVFISASDLLLFLLNRFVTFVAEHGLIADHLSFTDAVFLVLFVLVWLFFLSRVRQRPFAILLIAILLAGNLLIFRYLWLPSDTVKLAVIDVGQGDGILIKSGEHAVVIDGGGRGNKALTDLVRRSGIHEVDLLLLTHGDQDHASAVPGLLKLVPVKSGVIGPATLRDHAGEKAVAALLRHGTPVVEGYAGDRIETERFGTFELIFPFRELEVEDYSDNDLSLVILWEKDGFTALFPGDLTSWGEGELLQSKSLKKVNLMMAAHHGSGHSGTIDFLRKVYPETVCISCCRHNPYGHPSPELLERITRFDAKVLRTDLQGAILFRISNMGAKEINSVFWW